MADTPSTESPIVSGAKTAGLIGLWFVLAPIGAVLVTTAILVVLGVILFGVAFLNTSFVPAYSATYHIKAIDTDVRLKFYWVEDENSDNGRYLTVSNRHGSVRKNVCGYDWAHNSRTSLYLTDESKIAVLGTNGCDYIVDVQSLSVEQVGDTPSQRWTYLGAFMLTNEPPYTAASRALRFIDAPRQEECVVTSGTSETSGVRDLPVARAAARKERCPPPPPSH
jgi:hypothetical protein